MTFVTSNIFKLIAFLQVGQIKINNILTFLRAAVRSPFHFTEFSSELKSYAASPERPLFIFTTDKTQQTFLARSTSKRHMNSTKKNTYIIEGNMPFTRYTSFNENLHFLNQAYEIIWLHMHHVLLYSLKFYMILTCNLFIVFVSLFP